MTLNSASLQALSAKFMAKGAAIAGQPYTVYRANGVTDLSNLAPLYTGKVLANMSKDYNYNHAPAWDDLLWATIVDPTHLQIGDILVGALTYYVASMDPFLPLSTVRCNGRVDILRENSQLDSQSGVPGVPDAMPSQPVTTGPGGKYFGANTEPVNAGQPGVGEVTLGRGVPACLIANAGRATGSGQLPDDAPGPARWRIYVPASVFGEGSVVNRDVVRDADGHRYYVSAAQWSEMGYRLETVRLEM